MLLFLGLSASGYRPSTCRPSGMPRMAAEAERAGFAAILFEMPPAIGTDDPRTPRFDPLPLVGAAIGSSRMVGLGGYWPLDVAEPFHVARVFATLDHLSGGRTAWITGLRGADTIRPEHGKLALPGDPTQAAARADEFLHVVFKLWDSWEDRAFMVAQASGTFVDPERVHPILHEGAFFAVRGPLNVPRPVQGRPVVGIVDDGSDAMRDLAARHADLVFSAVERPEDAALLRERLRETASGERGRAGAPKLICRLIPVLAATAAEAERRVDELGLPAPGAIPVMAGSFDDVAERCTAWSGACDGLYFEPAVLPDDLPGLVAELMPRLVRSGLADGPTVTPTLRDRLRLHRPPSQYTI